jgi:hypothetical protein
MHRLDSQGSHHSFSQRPEDPLYEYSYDIWYSRRVMEKGLKWFFRKFCKNSQIGQHGE